MPVCSIPCIFWSLIEQLWSSAGLRNLKNKSSNFLSLQSIICLYFLTDFLANMLLWALLASQSDLETEGKRVRGASAQPNSLCKQRQRLPFSLSLFPSSPSLRLSFMPPFLSLFLSDSDIIVWTPVTVTDIGEGENVKQMYLLTFSFSAQLVSICFAGTDIDALKFFWGWEKSIGVKEKRGEDIYSKNKSHIVTLLPVIILIRNVCSWELESYVEHIYDAPNVTEGERCRGADRQNEIIKCSLSSGGLWLNSTHLSQTVIAGQVSFTIK